jgi:dienelactone hydrolase
METAEAIQIPAGKVKLTGDLTIPAGAHGAVLFAHGSGSSRLSPRNRFVAEELNKGGMATLLFDLLTQQEEWEEQISGHFRFDIPMLAERLAQATDFAAKHHQLHELPMGYFGASTGAAAALVAAVYRADRVHAVVSRGGRPDLAGSVLIDVKAPTLLIVGGADEFVIELNRQALQELRCEKKLEIVPEATHLFPEPGKLEQVAALAKDWFNQHLTVPS